ncbi:hypothetical protein ES703_76264 [subsurface metagenome]
MKNVKTTVKDILRGVKEQERVFLKSYFLAPIFKDRKVYTTVAGFSTTLQVINAEPGWAIIKPISLTRAKVISRPAEKDIQRYLNALPKVSFILAKKYEDEWFGFPAYEYHSKLGNLAPLNMRQINRGRGAKFCQVVTGYDGKNFWFLAPDFKRHPFIAEFLEDNLREKTPVSKLTGQGLTPQEKLTYRIALDMEKEPVEEMLKRVVAHGGGKLHSYVDRGDSYTIRFSVAGEVVSATVKKDLQIISAGFCLSGQDNKFDLASLTSIVREGRGTLYYD